MQAAGKQVSLPVFRVLERDQMKWTGHIARKRERDMGDHDREGPPIQERNETVEEKK